MTTKNRMRHLPLYKLNTMLSTLEEQVQALSAAPQFIGGSSIVFFQSDTGAEYDWTGTLTQRPGYPAGQGEAFLLVQATAVTMPNLYCNIITKLYVGSPTTLYTPADGYADQAADIDSFSTSLFNVPNSSPDGALNQVLIQVFGDLTRTPYVKVYALALDKVMLSVTQVG